MRLARVLTFAFVMMAFPLMCGPTRADDLPESLRLEQQAQKAYGQNPVVPIDRPNAHHRNSGTDDSSMPSDEIPISPDDEQTPTTTPEPGPEQQSK
jgi:hypothetical protein